MPTGGIAENRRKKMFKKITKCTLAILGLTGIILAQGGWTDGGTTVRLTTSTDNVGVGTTTVGSKLQVNGNSAIGYSASTAAPASGLVVNGNTGIGTTTVGSKLQVNGNAAIGYSASTSGPANGLIVSGRVGIGTTNPQGIVQLGNNFIVAAAPTGTASVDVANIRAAIAQASAGGIGGTVCLLSGNYRVDQTISLPSNITITGQGWGSTIIGMSNIPIFQTVNGGQFIQIKDMHISYDGSLTAGSSYQIEGVNSVNLKVLNVSIDAPIGRTAAGIRAGDCGVTPPAGVTPFMTHVENCLIRQGSIWLSHSDDRILNNFIWAAEDGSQLLFAIRLDNNATNVLISGNDIVSAFENTAATDLVGGIVCYSVHEIRIENNYFDGSWDRVHTSNPINAQCLYNSIISGNTFWNTWTGCVVLNQPHHLTISNNIFVDNGRRDLAGSDDITITSNGFKSNGIIIQGNNHFMNATRTNTHYAINVGGTFGARCQINNNAVSFGNFPAGYTSPYFLLNERTETSIANNRLNLALTSSTGTQPVSLGPNSFTTYTVTFPTPFPIAPRYDEINLTYNSSSQSGGLTYSISNLTNTGFKIYAFNSASATSGTLYWTCSLK
jgi:hypothetical protein